MKAVAGPAYPGGGSGGGERGVRAGSGGGGCKGAAWPMTRVSSALEETADSGGGVRSKVPLPVPLRGTTSIGGAAKAEAELAKSAGDGVNAVASK